MSAADVTFSVGCNVLIFDTAKSLCVLTHFDSDLQFMQVI